MTRTAGWQWPIDRGHRLVDSAGSLTFVGGVAAFDASGAVVHPGAIDDQIDPAFVNLACALDAQDCSLEDVVRLKAFYRSEGEVDEWRVLADLHRHFPGEVAPAMTTNPVPLMPYPGMEIQLQAIAMKGWREAANLKLVTAPVPAQLRDAFPALSLTQGLRACELIVVPGQTAIDEAGGVIAAGDGQAQTRIVMSRSEGILSELGAGFQDCIKKEGYYFGLTLEQWAAMAEIRASYFRDPAAVATVVPCQVLHPEGLVTKVEFIALRTVGNKYIPRADSWPERNWDWPIPVPYRQGIRLRDMIWVGGQVGFEPGANNGVVMYPGDVLEQTRLTMQYIEGILAGFDATCDDIALLICYFASDGTAAATDDFIGAVAESFENDLPPMTIVPQPRMHTDEMGVEIWAVAKGDTAH